jgi:hypothetical protein
MDPTGPSWNIVVSENGTMVTETRNNDPPRKVIAKVGDA